MFQEEEPWTLEMMRIWGKKGDTPPGGGGRWDTSLGGRRDPSGSGGRWDGPSVSFFIEGEKGQIYNKKFSYVQFNKYSLIF